MAGSSGMAASLNRFLSLIAPGWSSGHAADHTASPVILPSCGADEPRFWRRVPGLGKGRDEDATSSHLLSSPAAELATTAIGPEETGPIATGGTATSGR